MAELTDGTAELRVLVTTALGALPLENAIVSVSTAPDDTGMRTLLYSVTTDSGGMTPSMILTTPPRSNSLSPGSGPPFAVYTVEISAEGYTPLTALHIAMFSGVPTMLPVALTPLAENQSFAQTDLTATGAPQALDPELCRRIRKRRDCFARTLCFHTGNHHGAPRCAVLECAECHRAVCGLHQECGLVRDLSDLARAGHPRQRVRTNVLCAQPCIHRMVPRARLRF